MLVAMQIAVLALSHKVIMVCYHQHAITVKLITTYTTTSALLVHPVPTMIVVSASVANRTVQFAHILTFLEKSIARNVMTMLNGRALLAMIVCSSEISYILSVKV